MRIYINGKIVPERRAVLPVHDHGFLYGDGVYETLRVYRGKIFQTAGHLKRLKHSADGIRLRLPLSLKGIGEAMAKTVRANKLKEAVVRLTVSRGTGAYSFDPRPCKHPTLVIVAFPFTPYPPSYHRDGITAGLVSIRRNSPLSLPPHVKSTSCMNGILAKMESIDLGATEGIMLTREGFVAEGTVSNVFIVKRRKLMTPKLEGTLLAGVTRDYVCRLARRAGYRVSETKISGAALLSADEVFLTNTTMEVLPIARIVSNIGPRRRAVGIGRPGPVTRDLMHRFTASLQPHP